MTDPQPTESDAVRENRHQLYHKIDKIQLQVNDVHLALVGNDLGNLGLVRRLSTMEGEVKMKASQLDVAALSAKVEGHDRKLWFGMTILSALWACAVAFKELIFK